MVRTLACLATFVIASVIAPSTASAQPAVGVLNAAWPGNVLIAFDTEVAWDREVEHLQTIRGLLDGEQIVALDYSWGEVPPGRKGQYGGPNLRGLYGLGVNRGTGQVRLYRIDQPTARATPVGPGMQLTPQGGRYDFEVALTDNLFSVRAPDGLEYDGSLVTGVFAAHAFPVPSYRLGDPLDIVGTADAGVRLGLEPGPDRWRLVVDAKANRFASVGGLYAEPFGGPLGFDIESGVGDLDAGPDDRVVAMLKVGGRLGFHRFDLARGRPLEQLSAPQVDFDSFALVPGQVAFSSQAFASPERADATIKVWRSGPFDVETTVEYVAEAGTAGTADFRPTSGTLTFAPGEREKTFQVGLVDDDRREDDETVRLRLQNAWGLDLGLWSTAALTVLDDDRGDATPPAVRLADVRKSYSRKAFRKGLTFKVTTDEPSSVRADLGARIRRATAARARRAAVDYPLELVSRSLKPATGTRTVKLKPNATRFGRPRKSVKVRLRVVATDAAGNAATVTKVITIKP